LYKYFIYLLINLLIIVLILN